MSRTTARPTRGARRVGRSRLRRRRSPASLIAETAAGDLVGSRGPEGESESPGQDETLPSGEPDVSGPEAGEAGESVPAGSVPGTTAATGSAYGVPEPGEDRGRLRVSWELLDERDRRSARHERSPQRRE